MYLFHQITSKAAITKSGKVENLFQCGRMFPTLVEMFNITGLSNVYITCGHANL